jgi:hypothetical protein
LQLFSSSIILLLLLLLLLFGLLYHNPHFQYTI